jgi:glutaredoxin 3
MNITIYSKSNCPNCESAKALLDSKGLRYAEIDVEMDHERMQSLRQLYPDAKQMPQVFIDGQRVGGFAGLRVALNQMELL